MFKFNHWRTFSSFTDDKSHSIKYGSERADRDAGEVVEDYLEYSDAMKNLMNNKNYYVVCKLNAEKRYREIYDVPSIISKFVTLYREASNA